RRHRRDADRPSPAALLHPRENGARQLDSAPQREIDRVLPGAPVVAFERTGWRTAGVIHENVDAAELFQGSGGDALDVLEPREISGDSVDVRARFGRDALAGRLEGVFT